MENTSVSKKENPNLYVPEWYREMAKELMESFEATSIFSDSSKEELDRIEGMLYLWGNPQKQKSPVILGFFCCIKLI